MEKAFLEKKEKVHLNLKIVIDQIKLRSRKKNLLAPKRLPPEIIGAKTDWSQNIGVKQSAPKHWRQKCVVS